MKSWYYGMGSLERASWPKRILMFILFILSYPFLVLVYLVFPKWKVRVIRFIIGVYFVIYNSIFMKISYTCKMLWWGLRDFKKKKIYTCTVLTSPLSYIFNFLFAFVNIKKVKILWENKWNRLIYCLTNNINFLLFIEKMTRNYKRNNQKRSVFKVNLFISNLKCCICVFGQVEIRSTSMILSEFYVGW